MGAGLHRSQRSLHALEREPALRPTGALRHHAAYHRLRHSIEERHYDTNFRGFTQLWDRVLGTRMLPGKGDYPETGLQNLTSMRSWALLTSWPLLWLTRKSEQPGDGGTQKQ